MTRDELLEQINFYTICTRETKPGMVCDNKHLRKIYPEWFALRAVLEVHTPWTYTNYRGQEIQFCRGCWQGIEDGFIEYPCPTIQAIEEELTLIDTTSTDVLE